MLAKINQLPSEIAFRKESDVEKTILQFYIQKTQGGTGSGNGGGSETGTGTGSGNNTGKTGSNGGESNTDVIKEAKDKIKTTNMPNTMWQMAILNLLDEFPETAEFFKRL